MSTVAEQIAAVRAAISRKEHDWCVIARAGARPIEEFYPELDALRAALATLEGMASPQQPTPEDALSEFVHNYVEGYEFRDPDHTPTEEERALITDAIWGLISDVEFLRLSALDRFAAQRVTAAQCEIVAERAQRAGAYNQLFNDYQKVVRERDEATDKARREALLACFETTLPKEGEAWSREALNVMNIIRDRITALSTPQNPGDAAPEREE